MTPDEHNDAAFAKLEEQVRKLQAFKDFVHKRLDDAGIPTHPDGPHSKEGCRIGDRLDIALAYGSGDNAVLAVLEPFKREYETFDCVQGLCAMLPDDHGLAVVGEWPPMHTPIEAEYTFGDLRRAAEMHAMIEIRAERREAEPVIDRDEIARVLEIVAEEGLPQPRDLDVAIDAILAACFEGKVPR